MWLNIPLDVQAEKIAEPSFPRSASPSDAVRPKEQDLNQMLGFLEEAARPLLVCGNGVHLSHAESELLEFAERLGIPAVTTIGGMDLFWEDHPLNMGRFGPTGQRRANFAVQSADLLLCVGTSMSVAAIGFDTSGFAPRAKKVLVNIDESELEKPNLQLDFGMVADVKSFMRDLLDRLGESELHFDPRWLQTLAQWKRDYPLVTQDYFADEEHVNSYVLANAVSRAMGPGEVALSGNGLDAQSMFHSFAVKPGQKVITNSNYGAMGWDLPALVGACVARQGARTVIVTGDGSFEMNVQELLTIGHNRLNVKIFVLNNRGYESIRATQSNFCGGRFVGSDAQSGVGNPQFEPLAHAYGLEYRLLRTNEGLDQAVEQVLNTEGPFLCEVHISYWQERCPKIVSRKLEDGSMLSCSLDDQYPFLPEDERLAVMSCFLDE